MLTCPITNNKYLLSGIILAGGKSQRMNGTDKGLIVVNDQPMIKSVIQSFSQNCDEIIISANRHLVDYQQWQYPVYQDRTFIHCGPLGGIYQCLLHSKYACILISPCDTPYLPANYAVQLFDALCHSKADIAVSQYQGKMQPAHFLMKNNLKNNLKKYLQQGGRSLKGWHQQHQHILVPFKTYQHDFKNLNSAIDITALSKNK